MGLSVDWGELSEIANEFYHLSQLSAKVPHADLSPRVLRVRVLLV